MLTPSAPPPARPGRRTVLGAALATPVAAAALTATASGAQAADERLVRTDGSVARAADRHAPSCVADLLPDGA